MTRRRFYVPRELIGEGLATLAPSQAHHLRDVLRMRTGDVVEIFDGVGRGYIGQVDLDGNDVVVRGLLETASTEFPYRLTLAAALIKSAKFEWVLEKCTELGVEEIIPLRTHWSDIRISDEKVEARMSRWNRIVTEAARQCKRLTMPRLSAPVDFHEFLATRSSSEYARILFYEKAAELWRPALNLSARTLICIGPEGGWETDEVEQARQAGFQILGLGPLTLRAETAAIAAVSILQHHLHLSYSES